MLFRSCAKPARYRSRSLTGPCFISRAFGTTVLGRSVKPWCTEACHDCRALPYIQPKNRVAQFVAGSALVRGSASPCGDLRVGQRPLGAARRLGPRGGDTDNDPGRQSRAPATGHAGGAGQLEVFARSIPTVTMAMISPLGQVDEKFDLSIVAPGCRKPQP